MDTPDSNTTSATGSSGSFDLGGTLTSLTGAAGSILSAVKGTTTPAKTTAPQGAAASTSTMWLIVGAIIAGLTLLVIILKR